MSENLKGFLKRLGEEPNFREKYQNDPDGAMEEHGLSDDHKDLVKRRDKDKLKNEAGMEDAEMNFVIV